MPLTTTIKWISYAVILASVIVIIRSLPLSEGVAALKAWVESLGFWGPVVFGAIYILAVVLMVPASLLTLAGGATFGLLVGTVTVAVAANLGAAIALLIGRYLARDQVERIASRRPKFAAIDEAVSEGSWKVVAMLRLSPAIPFNVQNYLYGLTSIGFWTCVVTSFFAMLPGTFMYVYLGHAAGSVTGAGGDKTPAEWALLGIGLLATIAVTVYITRLAQSKLKEQTTLDEQEEGVDDDASSEERRDETSGQSSAAGFVVPVALALILGGVAITTLLRPGLVTQTLASVLPLGPPQVEMSEAYESRPDGPRFDHSLFDDVLAAHVDEHGWVDYESLAEDPKKLDAYIAAVAEAPFDELDREEKLALLINAYNAFTLRLILDHWPVDSIKDIPSAQRWADPRWDVGGNIWSLEQIEHDQIRPRFNEPRVHFALVCAAVGCPPLATEAYSADRLDSQLQDQTEYVHTHRTWLQIRSAKQVALTPLYQWYAGDFLQAAESVIAYAAKFNSRLEELLDSGASPAVTYLPYDWSLNSTANRQPR